ncbi:hypothetical protein DITRI_Ditri15bG0010300 [Diplodiscus trichospermus]
MEVVGAVVEVMLARVISLTVEQISLALGFKEELTMLHDSLTIIQTLLQDADKRKVEFPNQLMQKVSNFFSISHTIAFGVTMAKRIKKINASLNNISNQANLFGLQRRVPDVVLAPRGNQVTHSFLADSSLVIGREDDVS